MSKDLRPKTLDEYIGQEGIKPILSTAIRAAKERGEPLDHVLLNGPPGLGKTTLSLIIAGQMGWKMYSYIGAQLDVRIDNTILLLPVDRAVVFIDEIHRTRRQVQEVLYPVLEDNRTAMGVPLRPLTIIGATTAIGKLEQPFIDRFGLQFQLQYYTNHELTGIVQRTAEILGITMTDAATLSVATRSRGTPRIANNFVKRIRDFAQTTGTKTVTPAFVEDILTGKLKVDEDGLQELDRQYLKVLSQSANGMGVEALAAALHQDIGTVEDFVEPFLVSRGFVDRRRNGRFITEKGKSRSS